MSPLPLTGSELTGGVVIGECKRLVIMMIVIMSRRIKNTHTRYYWEFWYPRNSLRAVLISKCKDTK